MGAGPAAGQHRGDSVHRPPGIVVAGGLGGVGQAAGERDSPHRSC
jgi:hypothetical protein